MNGNNESQIKVQFSYDNASQKFVIKFDHPKTDVKSKTFNPNTPPVKQELEANSNMKVGPVTPPTRNEAVTPKKGGEVKKQIPSQRNTVSDIGPAPKLNNAQQWSGKVNSVIYGKIERNPDVMNKMIAIDELLDTKTFTSKELNFLREKIRTVGSGGVGYNRAQYSKIIDGDMRKNNIPKNDSLKTCVIYSLDIKMNNILEAEDTATGLIDYFTQYMKIQD